MSVIVGKPAPAFRAKAVKGETIIEDFSLEQYKGKKYVVLFSSWMRCNTSSNSAKSARWIGKKATTPCNRTTKV